ncbi:hypothetical protein B0H63DRAFT_487485 [Podospora didyma]|uniref:Uncharacterized protein n=1 Tax=Podospora didyma TaxID=330526 RepID=A0AAE0N600_9PEZI|nr:hypothetical protein B0H63DRAFT_487485 [Podospora didyma]
MNYANMIEEKRLKQGFIIATLISTIAGTFSTGINLFDRIAEKRKQGKLDKGQDKRIKELEKRVNESQSRGGRERSQQRDRPRAQDDDLRDSLQYGGNAVQDEFDRRYSQLGPRFAQGDLVAQTQLQSQVIILQGTVIKMLEEALLTGKTPDISKLYNVSEFAREGSVRALKDQYQRLLQAVPVSRRPVGPVRRISSTPQLRGGGSVASTSASATTAHRPSKTGARFDKGGPLFCRFAKAMQRGTRSLNEVFVSEVSSAGCPACSAVLSISPQPWRIDKEVVMRERRGSRGSPHDDRDGDVVMWTYLVTDRFMAKCHREDVGYSCYLCFRNRPRDTLIRDEESLVSHLVKEHGISEYEADPDIQLATQALTFH